MEPNLTAAHLGRAKEILLDAAARVLRHKGYAETSIRDIAAAAGIQAGSIYSHFKSKDELVRVVLDRGIERVDAAVRDAVRLAGNDPRARLEAAIVAHLHALFAQSDYTFASIHAFRSVPEAIRTANARLRNAYEQQWVVLIADCLGASADKQRNFARSVRLLLLGGMNSVIDWYRPEGELTLEKLGRDFAKAVTG